MRIFRRCISIVSVLVLTALIAAQQPKADSDKPLTNQTISGLVRDIACPVQNKQSTSRRFN